MIAAASPEVPGNIETHIKKIIGVNTIVPIMTLMTCSIPPDTAT